eukprot:15453569-Alexandrium_andersonii.AAC.1
MARNPKRTPQSAQGPSVLQSAPIRNPPFRTCKIASSVRTWNCAGPGTASRVGPKLPRDALCVLFRADSESAHESGPRGVR